MSNFRTVQLEALAETSTVPPMVNQCEMSVGSVDTDTLKYCQEHNITYQVSAGRTQAQTRGIDLNPICAKHGYFQQGVYSDVDTSL